MAWLMFLKLHSIRQKLRLMQETHLEFHRSQTAQLRSRWSAIQSCKRTIIHMASYGYPQHVRAAMPHFHIEQSLQMGRFCDIQGMAGFLYCIVHPYIFIWPPYSRPQCGGGVCVPNTAHTRNDRLLSQACRHGFKWKKFQKAYPFCAPGEF